MRVFSGITKKELLILFTFMMLSTFIFAGQVNAAKEGSHTPGGTTTIGNNILEVSIEDVTGNDGFGTYTIATGPGHTNPGQDVFYDGVDQDPWSTYNTIHVTDTSRDYTTSSSSSTPDAGFTLVLMDTLSPAVTTSTSTRVVIQWTTLENLLVEQDIEVVGTTIADTYVRVTMSVTNNDDQSSHTVGIRYQWDIMIDGYDGSWIRPWDGAPGTWLDVETSWAPPTFNYWETTNDPTTPVFSVLGSNILPSVTPSPTVPDTFMLAAWGSTPSPGLYDYAYSFTPTSRTIAGTGLDSAVAYYWDPVDILPGATRSVTAYVWCRFITPTPEEAVGGTIIPASLLMVLAPWIILAVMAVAVGLTARGLVPSFIWI